MSLIGYYSLSSNFDDNLFLKICEYLRLHYKTVQVYQTKMFKLAASAVDYSIWQANGGIIIGKLFSKSDWQPFSQRDADNINYDNCNKLYNNYWGAHLSFLTDKDSNKFRVLVDPATQLSIYYYKIDGGIIFATEIAFMKSLLSISLKLNWDYLINFLLQGNILGEQTAFQDIHQVPPGCILDCDLNKTDIEIGWNPQVYCQNKAGKDNAETIAETLEKTIECWSEDKQQFFLEFSGGLDSSAILYALSKQKKNVFPVNFFHPLIPASIELEHAEAITNDIDVSLIKQDWSNSLPLSSLTKSFAKLPNSPSIYFIHFAKEKELYALTTGHENYLYLNGHGGDSIFLNPPPMELLSDYIIDNGFSGFYQKLVELAVYYRYPIPNLAINAIKDMVVNRLFGNYKTKAYFDSAPWLKIDPDFLVRNSICHPYLIKADSLSKGKFLHIENIFATLASVNQDIRDPNQKVFYPFLSQPLIEFALSIPSYKTFQHYYDRYPVRKAVSTAYNTNRVWRKGKGETSGVFHLGLKQNLTEVLALCLEGKTVKQGLIDSNMLYANIKNIINGIIDFQWPLVHLICLELYLNCWS